MLDAGFQFLPSQVDGFFTRQMVESSLFDPVHQFLRWTVGRHAVEKPARSDRLISQIENATGQNIAASEIVQQPAVELKLFQGLLYGGQIEHG